MRQAKFWLLTLSLLPLAVTLKANEGSEGKSEPVIQGVVSDAVTKRPVRGVTVSIQCGNRPMQVVSDASGNFRIPGMPAGQVTLILEKKGYRTYRKEGLTLKQGMIININMDNLESEMEESDVFHPLRRMIDGF